MDFLKDLLGSQAGNMISSLVEKNGFSAEQAQTFVPEAGKAAMNAVQGNIEQFDMNNLGSDTNITNMMSLLPIGQIASKVGISESMVKSGLQTILPQVLSLLKGNEALSGILDQLGGLEQAKGMLGNLGGLFGK